MLISKDTPKELVQLISAIDVDKIPASQVKSKIAQLDELIAKHLDKRTAKPETINVNIRVPKEIADLTIKYNMNVGRLKLALGLPIIRNYIKNNLPLRRAI